MHLSLATFLSFVALTTVRGHGSHHHKKSSALQYANMYTPSADDDFTADCAADDTPRGTYGAFFEPCRFDFFVVDGAEGGDCESGTLVGEPLSYIWPENRTLARGHGSSSSSDSSDSGDESSSDSDDGQRRLSSSSSDEDRSSHHPMLSVEDLALWPDQCVGAGPRCYPIQGAVNETLRSIFSNVTWPASATHVRVNCQADATEYTAVSYQIVQDEAAAAVRRRNKVVGAISGAILAVAALLVCCVCVACRRRRRRRLRQKSQTPPTAEGKALDGPVAVAVAVDADQKTDDGLSVDEEERKNMI